MVSAQTRPERPPRTPLADLAEWLRSQAPETEASGDLGTVVTGLTLSSQRTFPGDVYAALPGAQAHGIVYAADALAAGAVALLTDPEGAAAAPGGVPLLVVPEPRRLLGRLAARVYGDPAASMRMIGVTGTQGKTTTTRLAEGGLQRAEVRAGAIGTVGTRIAGEEVKTSLTTPEAPDLHALFALMREREVRACAMEVSSHALVMGRVDGVVFDVAVFLNLGRDHLDFHRDEEDYYRAKASLFTPERARLALIGVDDAHGRRLAGETPLPVRTFSTQSAEADWTVSAVRPGPHGTSFRVHGPGGPGGPGGADGIDLEAGVPLPGAFNVANALAAVAACAEAGFPPDTVAAVASGIAAGEGVPGRFERIDAGQPFTVVVDYAHKPDAVEAALESLRPLTTGRLLVVLGAGGDRDLGKRPIMGEIAARLADVLVVTDDNPRTEDPATIRSAVLSGARRGAADVLEEGDRRSAIAAALGLARAGDIVVVAGKGHETGQEVAGVVHPFDDRAVVRELLAGYRPG
jgi:UDP-N-acetylmuramoyl-L-alanyl-D-glutamate--2,6-diaminopimelate ligase